MATKEEYTNTFWFPDTELKRAEHIWMCRNIQGTTQSLYVYSCILAVWRYDRADWGGIYGYVMSYLERS